MEISAYPQRKPTRLLGFDYSQVGAYFITICTYNRRNLFGDIVKGEMVTNSCGEAVTQSWIQLVTHFSNIHLDEFAIMPNHLHGVIVIDEKDGSPLPDLIRELKSYASRRLGEIMGKQDTPIWQRGFYDHVIRNDRSLQAIKTYIVNNPVNWDDDEFNPHRKQGSRSDEASGLPGRG